MKYLPTFWQRLDTRFWLTPALLVAVVLLVYANSFPGAFIQDDLHIVKNNPLVVSPDLTTIFTSDYWHGYHNTGLYRPLTITSLALNRLLLGEAPWGFHLANLILHVIATLLLWRLLCRWGATSGIAALAATLYGIHPIHTEVLNEVVGRSELLVAVLLLTGFLMAERTGAKAGCVVCFCFLGALLAKEHAITFPALLLLVDGFRERTLLQALKRRWPLYATLTAVALAWLLWRQWGLVQVLPPASISTDMAPLAPLATDTRVLTALLLQGMYLLKLVFPVGLQAVYSTADLPAFISSPFSIAGVSTLAGSLLVVGLISVGWQMRHPLGLWGALYFSSFAVTANLAFPIGVSFAERLAYFPSIWFCAGVATLLWPKARADHGALVRKIVVLGCVLLLGLTCVMRNRDFASEVALWHAEVRQNPADYLGWLNYAEALANDGQVRAAEEAYQAMAQLAPQFIGGLRSQVVFYLAQERYGDALPLAARSMNPPLEREDRYGEAMDRLNLARIHLGLRQHEEVLALLDDEEVFVAEGNSVHELRGRALTGLNGHAQAVEAYGRATEFLEMSTPFYYGLSLLQLGRLKDARRQLEQAIVIAENAESWNLLGATCANEGDWLAARRAFSRAIKLAPENPYYRENLERAVMLDHGAQISGDR